MEFDYFLQSFFLLIFCNLILSCGKKNKKTNSVMSKQNESIMIKSGIKPVTIEGGLPLSTPKEEKKEEAKAEEAKETKAEGGGAGGAGGGSDGGGEQKDEPKKEEPPPNEADKKDPVAKSQKPFPKFVMPTESTKKKKEKEAEADKNKKIKEGFYQAKSDEDDTLEKIESLKVEKSDKTKRSQRKKKP